jgi:hypothetical protein
MAKFSQQFLKSMSSPGLFEMGVANLGDKLSDMRLRQRQTRESENIQQILQANINNPAKLQQLAQEYQIKGNAAAAAAFQDAANRVTAKDTEVQKKGVQGGLTAITQAAMRGTALSDLQEAQNSVIMQGGTQEQIMSAYKAGLDLTKAQKPQTFQGTPGTQFLTRDDETGNLIVEATVPFKGDSDKEAVDKPYELARTGKYTPESIQDAIQPNGTIDYSLLEPIGDAVERGNVSSSAEKRNNTISENATKASVSLSRNRALQQSLFQNPEKSTGIVSDLRTSALNLAGLRDAEEEDKTAFLRTRNTDIINSLPPGVASDTDVRIFSQGFPDENASTPEIMRYLQAEERILAAASDMALVSDRHLQTQIDAGLDATMVGFENKKQQYGTIMQKALRDIEEQTAANPENATEIEQRIIRQVSEVLGFVPKFYR